MGQLDGKVAVVTGGASGIGRAIACAFVEEGARVFIGDLNASGIGGLVAELGHNYVDGTATDVTSEEDVGEMIDKCVRRFGALDLAVNNAGAGTFSPIQDHPAAEFRRVIDLCLTGVFFCLKHESAELIREGRGGSIVNISSLNAIQPAEGFAAYCSAKAGVAMLTQVAALELGRHNIRVNAIGPGLIATPATEGLRSSAVIYNDFLANTPLGRSGETSDVAGLAVYLASDVSEFLSGQSLYIDGGQSLKRYPSLFDALGAAGGSGAPPDA